ncbi:hypothetical protein HZF05_07105 [Sphingomonas sp. CGMCC 1.13654]|uniref:Uncharacterized protein n=1 Tax=Sphingomonas chungangi TaxID=2683589 RepID=A0A838L8L2_9SPHN|nr:hypothetical protein [Sphingomonas chungangi]MBA2933868.1 hypothetical protein [Sphingomonas chungangi]MVW55198.1 hypothetical protein [Sphingomonas chungangi]
MTDQIPSWMSIDRTLGDLGGWLPKLQTYVDLADHWRDIATSIWKDAADAPVDGPVKLVLYLDGKLADPAVLEVFSRLGLDAFHAKLVALGNDLTDASAPWAKLLMPCSSFVESYGATAPAAGDPEDGDNPGLVVLKSPALDQSGTVAAGPGSLKFDVSAAAGLECEAGSVWPFRSDGVAPGLLRIGVNGKVAADAGLSLPFGEIGTGHFDTSASADARLDLFFRPADPARSFVEALVPSMTRLPDPLDLQAIADAVQLAGMEGLLLVCDGSASAGLGATIGADYELADIGAITAGAVADLSFKRSARWLLSLRATPDGLHFVLSRNLSCDRGWSAGVDVELDYSALASKVHDALVKANDLAQPMLAQIRPFLSPGTYLRDEAGKLVDDVASAIVTDPVLKTAVRSDIGLVLGTSQADDLAVTAYLKDRIVALAGDQAGGILSDVDRWTKTITDGLASRLPLLADVDLQGKLTGYIKPILSQIETDFGATVAKLVNTQGLATELKSIGVDISADETRADALLAGVRALVDKFDGFARDLISKTGDGVAQKLQARFGWSGGTGSGTEYELIGTFRDTSETTAQLWRSLATGHLEPFQRILAAPETAPAGVSLDAASSLSRFAGANDGFTLEVIVLGITASIKDIVEGKAQITQSASGDIAVSAQGTASDEVDGFDEGRAASFVSAWDLALHKIDGSGTRQMSVAIAFDHDDKKLDSGEVSGFLDGLAHQGLVEPARVQRAIEVYQAWRNATPPGQHVQGRIDVRMALSGAAVIRMLALGRQAGTRASSTQFALFAAAGQALLATGVTDQKSVDRDCRAARPRYKQLDKIDDPWRIMYALQDNPPPDTDDGQDYVYTSFEQITPRAISFPGLLAVMARIYDAVPVGSGAPSGAWQAQDYADAEKEMAKDAAAWLRLNRKFLFWFKAGIHPVLLAFLRLLADLDRPLLAGEDPFATLGQHPDTIRSSQLFAITMKQPTGAPVTI